MAFIKEIQTPDNIKHQIKNTIIPVIGTQTSSTSSWTGNIDLPSLYDGLTIAYFLPYDSVSGTSVNLTLTLNDGDQTDPIACYISSGRLGTQYTKGSNIIMTYWSKGSIKINGTVTTNNRWVAHADYNTDIDTTYSLSRDGDNVKLSPSSGTATTAGAANLQSLTNEDLNTITIPGFYYAGGGNTCSNKPSGTNAFGLMVMHTAAGSFYYQFLNQNGQSKTFRRICSNGTWGDWVEEKITDTTYTFATGDSNGQIKVTPSSGNVYNVDVKGLGDRAFDSTEYLPLTGGTVTGAINIKSSNLDRDGEAPTSDQTGKSLYFVDKDSNGVGRIYTIQRKTNNKKDLFITVYNASGTSNSIGIRILDDGTPSYYLSYPSAFRAALNNAAYIDANTITNNQVIIADGTDGKLKSSAKLQFDPSNCTLTFYNETTTADDIPITFDFDIKDTDTGKTYSTYAFMKWYQDHGTTTSGLNFVLQSAGGIFLGGGEAPNKHYLEKTTDNTDPNNPIHKNYTNEETFITSDSSIHLQANAGTITNRKGLQINNNLELLPEQIDVATNNIGSIGTSTYKWSNGYFTNINGVAVGDSPSFTDTKNTASSANTSSKIYLIGATSQTNVTDSIHTYSHDTVYVGTNGHLYSNSKQVVNLNDTQALTNKTYNGYTLADACAKGVTDNSSATAVTSSDTNLITARTLYYAGYTKNTGTVTSIKVGDTSYSPSSGVVSLPDYLKLSGGTLTGSLYVCGTTEKRISLKNSTDNSLEVYMASATNGRHGLYSTGYLNGTTYTQNGKWLVMRDSNGKVYFNGCTIESSVPDDAVFTDEKVKTESYASTTKQYLIFKSNIDDTNTCYANSNLGYYSKTGTANALGYSQLSLGNSTNQGTANNSYGILRLYPQNGAGSSSYSRLIQKDMSTNSAIFHTLPDTGDELVNLSATQTLTNKTLEDCFFFKTKNTSSDLQHPDILLTEEFVNTDKYSFRLNMTSGQINYQWTRYNGNTNTKKIRDIISIGSNGNITITNDTNTTTPSAEGRKLILGSGSITVSNASDTATTSIVEDYLTSGTISATTTTSTNINVKKFSSTSGDISVQSSLTFANGKNIQMADAIAMQVNKVNNVSQFSLGISTLKLVLYGSSYYLATGSAITSDKRLKTNIEIMDNRYLNLIKNLEPKRFKLKNNPSQKYHTGFIAQDVQELLKKYNINEEEFAAFARPKEDDSEYALSYTEFIPLLLLYIKDLEKQIKEIKEQD